jgi:hypothetical protein
MDTIYDVVLPVLDERAALPWVRDMAAVLA